MRYSVLNTTFDFSFNGGKYNKVFFSSNGLVSLEEGSDDYADDDIPARDFPLSDGFPLIAALWNDLDSRDPDQTGHIWWKKGPNYLAIAWDHVDTNNKDGAPYNTFQVIISDGTYAPMGTNNVCMCYEEVSGVDGDTLRVGIDGGNGVDGFSLLETQNDATAAQFAEENPVLCYDVSTKLVNEPGVIPAVAGKKGKKNPRAEKNPRMTRRGQRIPRRMLQRRRRRRSRRMLQQRRRRRRRRQRRHRRRRRDQRRQRA